MIDLVRGVKRFNVTAMEVDFEVEAWPKNSEFNRWQLDTGEGVYFIASVQLKGVELVDVLSEFTMGQICSKVRKLCW